MCRLIVLLTIAVLTAVASSGRCPAFSQASLGEVTGVAGHAEIERGGKKIQPALSMAIELHDVLRTMTDGALTVTMRDGSTLALTESSSYTIERYALASARREARIALWAGRLRAVVSTVSGIPDFEVRTPNAVTSVRGTEFETAFIEGRPCPEDHTCMRYTTVGVISGVVEVKNPSNPAPPVRVTEGYETTVPCESAPTSPAPLGMQELGTPSYH